MRMLHRILSTGWTETSEEKTDKKDSPPTNYQRLIDYLDILIADVENGNSLYRHQYIKGLTKIQEKFMEMPSYFSDSEIKSAQNNLQLYTIFLQYVLMCMKAEEPVVIIFNESTGKDHLLDNLTEHISQYISIRKSKWLMFLPMAAIALTWYTRVFWYY